MIITIEKDVYLENVLKSNSRDFPEVKGNQSECSFRT